MIFKQSGLALAFLWLVGCASPDSGSLTPIQDMQQELAMEHELEKAMEHELEKALQQEQELEIAFKKQHQTLTGSRVLASLEHIASLEAKSAKQRVKQLQTKATELTPGERFELALLLSRKGADEKSLQQARQLFKRLETETKEPGVQAILRLQQRNLTLEEQVQKERKKTIELQIKIEHLKGLEQELEESNKRMDESLSLNSVEQHQGVHASISHKSMFNFGF